MSRTYRKCDKGKGKPSICRNENQQYPYRFWRRECKNARKSLWKSYRLKCKLWIKKYREIPTWFNTQGWNTW